MRKTIYLLIILGFTGCQKEEFDIIGTTESFITNSSNVNDDFKINVYLPPNYPEATIDYPLIIGLDANFEFESMTEIVSQKINNGEIPPAVFVGIGYKEDKEVEKRNRDYTPSITQGVEDYQTGGAENFYSFIKDELIPELENKYQIDNANTKTLMGHSYGGLFTLYAMFQDRNTSPFDKFIPVGSSFWYDSGVIFEYEEAYSENHSDFQATVFTTMGSLEGAVMVISFEEMNERITNRNYPNLTYKDEILKKYGHSRSDVISYQKGLTYVFNN